MDKDLLPALLHRTAFGVRFTALSLTGALDYVRRRGATERFGYVVTPNAQHVVFINRHRERFGSVYHEHALLCLCDSQIVRLLARLAGVALPLCTGSDLTAALLAGPLPMGETVTVIGCEPELVERLQLRFPGLHIQHYNPPMGFIADAAAVQSCVEFIEANPARYVFLAVGAPQSEELACQLARRGRATGLGLCIGSSLHFLIGARRRAPRWMRQAGLEWLFRLLQEPRRLWRRVFVESMPLLPLAAPAILHRLRLRLLPSPPPSMP